MLSVIIPVFNRPRQFLLAVDSVFRQRGLNETLEIIVVDDYSVPPMNLGEIAGWKFDGRQVKLLRLAKNSGPAAARNAGILAASGEQIAFLDSDDLWLPDKLARQVALLDKITAAQPERLHAVSCGFYYRSVFNKRLHARAPVPASSLIEFAGGCWFSPGSTLLLRRDCLVRVGLFEERLRALEDFEWFLRFGRLGGHLHVVPHPDVIVFRQSEARTAAIVTESSDLIETKHALDSSTKIWKNEGHALKAYLNLEKALSCFQNGNLLAALHRGLRSLFSWPRLRPSVHTHWTRSTIVPPEIDHHYQLMTRAALPKPIWPGEEPRCAILFVVYSLSLGGTEKHLSLVLPALIRRGYCVKVYNISGVKDAQISDLLDAVGIKTISASVSHGKVLGRRLAILLHNTLGLLHAYRLERPQIVHFFLPRAYMIGAPLAWWSRIPTLIMSRRSLNVYQKKHWMLSRFERTLHTLMTVIVGNSKEVVNQLHEEERVPYQRLDLIHNGIDIASFERPLNVAGKRSQLGLAPDGLVLIKVANLFDYKGHADLLQAMASIKFELPESWVLLLVGRNYGVGGLLKDMARSLGIADRVLFLGQRSDVPELMRIADIGLLCSHEEGFSNALLEMMAAGLPCVATDVGGNPEAVVEGETGSLVPARNPDALAKAILRLANDAQLRQQMGGAGYARVRQHFSLDACVDGYERLYRSLLDCNFLPLRRDKQK